MFEYLKTCQIKYILDKLILAMTKSISCADAGKDCGWSASAQTEEELMDKVAKHVKEDHKEIELTLENIASIKSLIKEI